MPPRSRASIVIAVVAMLAVAGAWLAVRGLGRDEGGDSAASAAAVTPTPTSVITSPDAPAQEAFTPLIATIESDSLDVYDAPAGTKATTLDQWSEATFQPLTLLVVDDADVDGATWLKVMMPVQPNQSTGWVRAQDVSTTPATAEIRIFIDELELELWDNGSLVLTAPVALGAADTPTPPGVYSITDPLDSTHNTTGVYGAYALGLSGFSETLTSFDGAPPQLAIHGTNQPELIGSYVSNGCIRMRNEDILTVVDHAGLGTPVYIFASRSDAT